MPYFRASFRHTFSTGDTVEMTSNPFKANSWDQARDLAKAFGYDDDVRLAIADVDQNTGTRTEYPQLTMVE